jgi:hypothetical protein
MRFDRLVSAKIRRANADFTEYRDALDISGLRIAFSVNKTFSSATNSAVVRIYNLSASKRNDLRNFGDQLRLFAGYRDQEGEQLLFVGNISQFNHSFIPPEIVTSLQCGDGEKTLNNTIISVSFGQETPIRTVIEYVAEKIGLSIAYFAPSTNLLYGNGFNNICSAQYILDDACQALDLTWSVQNDNLYIIRSDGATEKPPAEVNAENGMIGTPERYVDKKYYLYRAKEPNEPLKPGWKVRTLLRPELLPGDRIRLKSTQADIDGVFKILSARHEGDNFGPIFESNFEVYPL